MNPQHKRVTTTLVGEFASLARERAVAEARRPRERGAPFEIKLSEYQNTGRSYGKLRVNTQILSDSVWAEYYQPIEDSLANSTLNRLDIDLRACLWGDPIPLLCLVILATRLRASGVTVQVWLSLPSRQLAENIGSLSFESNPRLLTNGCRFLSFLANEGFIDSLLKVGVEIELKGNNRQVLVKQSQDVVDVLTSAELAYQNSTALTVDSICVVGPFTDAVRRSISDQVSARLNDPVFQARVQAQVENRFSEELISRLRVILIEGLINVAEHAYEDPSEPKVGAFYVRFRKGLIGATQPERQRLNAFIRSETRDSARLDSAFLNHQKGCLEVFVADSGVGLVKKLEVIHPEITGRTHPFRFYIENVLTQGISSNPDRRTAQGALSLIHRNASRYGDYLRLYSDKFWFGGGAPIIPRQPIAKMVTRNKLRTGPSGLYWQFRLAWQSSTDVDESWVPITKYPEAMTAAQAVYSAHLTDAEREAFANVLVLHGGEEFSTDEDSEARRYLERHRETETVVWFSGRRLLKNDILKRVAEISEIDENRIYRRLCIVDIEPYDADFYLWALRGLRTDIRNIWPVAIKEIVLVTTTWKVCVLRYWQETAEEQPDSARHGYREESARSEGFFQGRSRSRNFADGKICELLAFFRWQASQQFWKTLSTEDQLHAVYFNGTVEWSENPRLNINGYLDFGLASTIATAKAILAAELKRYCLLHADSIPALYSFDSYVANIVDFVDWQLGSKAYSDSRPRHGIGSVLVTGKTLAAHNAEEGKHVHFFAHPNAVESLGKARTLLFWPAGENWFDSKVTRGSAEPKRRIGSTAAISAKGNKTFVLPRWAEDGQPVALRAPQSAYQDFQDLPPLIQAGHWSDGAHHDFLSLNIRNAVNRSDIDGEGVFTYIAACIVHALNLRGELTAHGKSRLRSFRERHGSTRGEFSTRACAVVYPMRGDAAHIIELFLERYISPETRNIVAKRLIGIGNIRATGARLPLLMSPSAQERIKAALEKKEKGERGEQPGVILFIDDAVITGKTHTEINAVLRALGAKNVVTAIGVDRRRLPSGRVSPENLSSYWRLDVPPLGDSYSCPLCTARSSLGLLTSLLSSDQLIAHTNGVRNRWAAMDPNRDWDKALRPVPLKQISLRYGLGEGAFKEVRHQVDIRSSTALSSWYIELETMTGSEQAFDRAFQRLAGSAVSGTDEEEMARLELLSSAVLYFAGSLAPKRLLSIVEDIISSIIRNGSNSDHTSLGALAIISAIDTVTQYGGSPFESILEKHFDQDVEGLSDDARMLITALIAKRAVAPSHPRVLQLSRLLFGMPVPLAHRYNLFHGELISPIGNFHGRPLIKISEGVNFNADVNGIIREAIASCDFLLKFIQTIPFDFAASGGTAERGSGVGILERVDGAAARAKDALRRASGDGGRIADARKSCEHLVSQLKELRDRLAIGSESIHTSILALISEVKDDWPLGKKYPNDGVKISNQRKGSLVLREDEVRWVVWDNQIRLMIRDILKNCLSHNNGSIQDPFGAPSTDLAAAWLVWQTDEKDILIQVANSIKLSNQPIKSLETKGATRFRRLRDLGGDIFRDENSSGHYITTIRIPYMGYCELKNSERNSK